MGILQPFISAFLMVLSIIEWIVFAWVILSWILFFASQTSFRWRNRGVYNILVQLNDIFTRMTSPFLRPFRRMLPAYKTAGIDWSPLMLLIAIFIIRGVVSYLAMMLMR